MNSIPFDTEDLKLEIDTAFFREAPFKPEVLYSTKKQDIIDGWINNKDKNSVEYYEDGILKYQVLNNTNMEILYTEKMVYYRSKATDDSCITSWSAANYSLTDTDNGMSKSSQVTKFKLLFYTKKFETVSYENDKLKIVVRNGKLIEKQDK